MANCNSCGVEIVWARTVTGKASPMERADDGTWIIDDDGVMRQGNDVSLRLAGGPRYKSHFATCVDAKKWRRRG